MERVRPKSEWISLSLSLSLSLFSFPLQFHNNDDGDEPITRATDNERMFINDSLNFFVVSLLFLFPPEGNRGVFLRF